MPFEILTQDEIEDLKDGTFWENGTYLYFEIKIKELEDVSGRAKIGFCTWKKKMNSLYIRILLMTKIDFFSI